MTPDELVEANVALAHHVAWRYKKTSPEALHADIESDALLGLLTAARKFDPERGLAFSTFAVAIIKGAIQDGYVTRRALKRRAHAQAVSLEWLRSEIAFDPGEDEAGYGKLEDADFYTTAMELLQQKLSPRDAKIVHAYFQGKTLREVGDLYDISGEWVRQTVLKAMRVLRAAL